MDRGEVNMLQRIYVTDGSIDGIFTAIYRAWESKYGHKNIKLIERDENETLEFFSEYIDIEPEQEISYKVAKTIKERLSNVGYKFVVKACLSKEKGRSDAVYRFLLLGFSVGASVLEQLAHPYVYPIYKMNKNVTNEVLHYMGFLRFEELKNGVLCAKIRPLNNILTLLSPHFSDRFQNEDWLIIDERRGIAALHKKRSDYLIVECSFFTNEAFFQCSDEETYLQHLWKSFINSIGISERENEKLRQQMLPKRFREFMKEFD